MGKSNTKTLHVLVIAHPDDESMFFVPTVRSLVEAGEEMVWMLCLTAGDYDGLGKVREKELVRAGALLGIAKVLIYNDELLQDHPVERWEPSDVSKVIRQSLEKESLKNMNLGAQEKLKIRLITFDPCGVSGHVNHRDTYKGVCEFVKSCKNIPMEFQDDASEDEVDVEAWQLNSESNILYKYLPVLSWLLLLWSLAARTTGGRMTSTATSNGGSQPMIIVHRLHEPWLNWRAMATHKSQFVWYRRLFVIFSCYTYVNKLTPIQPSSTKS